MMQSACGGVDCLRSTRASGGASLTSTRHDLPRRGERREMRKPGRRAWRGRASIAPPGVEPGLFRSRGGRVASYTKGQQKPPIEMHHRRNSCKIAGVGSCFNPFRPHCWSSPDHLLAPRAPAHDHPRIRVGSPLPVTLRRRVSRKPLGLRGGTSRTIQCRAILRRAGRSSRRHHAQREIRIRARGDHEGRSLAVSRFR